MRVIHVRAALAGDLLTLKGVTRDDAKKEGIHYLPAAPRVQEELLDAAESMYGDYLRSLGLSVGRDRTCSR